MKMDDEQANTASDPVTEQLESVLSGRIIEDIAAAPSFPS
jgi:hypothetical protein